MRELVSVRTLAGTMNDPAFYVVCKLYGDGYCSVTYSVRGKSCYQEFKMQDTSRFDELCDHFKEVFDAAGDFSCESFNVVDCFMDTQINKYFDEYFEYEDLNG